jgi:hypothetical protein
MPAMTFTAWSGSWSATTASPATTSGCIAPTVAATPPGSRYAPMNSSAKNTPKLHAPSTNVRGHHTPRGSCRVSATSSTPVGSARTAPARSGRPGGNSSDVTM